MTIDLPIRNADGTVQFTATLNDVQVQALLQFGMNMAFALGLAETFVPTTEDKQMHMEFND